MVIDTSALVAILLDEPERQAFNQQSAADAVRLVSAATLVETTIVLTSRKGPRAQAALDRYLATAGWRSCRCGPSTRRLRATPIACMARAAIRQGSILAMSLPITWS